MNYLGVLKWVGVAILAIAFLLGAWLGLAWLLGFSLTTIFHLNLIKSQFIGVGSCILVFTMIVQIITVVVTVWFLITWGKAKVQKVAEGAVK